MQLFFWSRDVLPVQNLLLCTKFHRNRMIFRWDMAIYRFSKWRPSAILELFHHHTRPPTKSFHGALQNSASSNRCWLSWHSGGNGWSAPTAGHRTEEPKNEVWRYSYLNFFCIFGLKCLIRTPKWGFWGNMDRQQGKQFPECVCHKSQQLHKPGSF